MPLFIIPAKLAFGCHRLYNNLPVDKQMSTELFVIATIHSCEGNSEQRLNSTLFLLPSSYFNFRSHHDENQDSTPHSPSLAKYLTEGKVLPVRRERSTVLCFTFKTTIAGFRSMLSATSTESHSDACFDLAPFLLWTMTPSTFRHARC